MVREKNLRHQIFIDCCYTPSARRRGDLTTIGEFGKASYIVEQHHCSDDGSLATFLLGVMMSFNALLQYNRGEDDYMPLREARIGDHLLSV